jgi:hypothetical protein
MMVVTIKIPDPIIDPATMLVASVSPNVLLKLFSIVKQSPASLKQD